ncbi:3-isopropylmalate dehydrogenase, putative [Talaromyces stipitatus ATCC 10500]|uniref:3-isopropylmalate dehydrogenase, putative n=1 Tax=Talaromyces stipitatus (strain ATCC 10500 / CBS 375.48 / QM 6759 / NRRL 1006) TaxID=441959 RepID=B8M960_TALSN|nr:3-isopropylmalate dehydrogenase, putative [Talaromyces stipitatus ATCC 10500]EED17355.1 3-isopropylmalate dehydrogenase, putative [Talaromyces stipitatus ATCC 10500]
MATNAFKTYRIATIPGDGIGPLDFTELDWSTARYKKTGKYMPDDGLNVLKTFDAGIFGAVGAPEAPDLISLWNLLLAIRGPMQLYANVRPVKNSPKLPSLLRGVEDGDIDWLLVRENSEGECRGQGGRTHRGTPWEAATERIMRFAFDTARSHPRKLLTVVTKSNAMLNGMVLWDEVAAEVAREYPDVKWDKMLVDAMTVRMAANPESLDTIVGTNLHIDILSDLAAALAGSIGIAASSNLDPTRKNPSLFEPVHGSAFDITGKGIANPVATLWSASKMLD